MQGGIETLPSSVLQEIVNGRLEAVDLARLECCSSMFRAPSGIMPCHAKSITEAAAHHSCQTHPVFENLPPHACSALLARCDGHWKQVLYFLECLLCMRGPSAPTGTCSNVVATASTEHTLIVNGIGELYITSGENYFFTIYGNIRPDPQSNLKLIFSQPTANRILQISANVDHAAFVTETGQALLLWSWTAAKVDSGVLTVVVPKAEKKKETRRIEIDGVSSQPAATALEGKPAPETDGTATDPAQAQQ